jgi:hypothetical protein
VDRPININKTLAASVRCLKDWLFCGLGLQEADRGFWDNLIFNEK